MLCDDFINYKYAQHLDNFEYNARAKIVAANKFVIAADMACAADGLIDNTAELERILPFCRLPYRLCWFEVAQSDRPHFVARGIHNPERQSPAKRIGFLVEAQDDEFKVYKVHLFWLLRSISDDVINRFPDRIPSLLNFSIIALIMDVSKPLGKSVMCQAGDFGVERVMSSLIATRGPGVTPESLFHDLQQDWGGEVRFLYSVLGLLNARNVVEAEYVDKSEHNRKRSRRGDAPLASHTVLKVRMAHKKIIRGDARVSVEHAQMRAHFVRGHFKQRSTGLFWWGPFMRGSLDQGYVGKDYVLTR